MKLEKHEKYGIHVIRITPPAPNPYTQIEHNHSKIIWD